VNILMDSVVPPPAPGRGDDQLGRRDEMPGETLAPCFLGSRNNAEDATYYAEDATYATSLGVAATNNDPATTADDAIEDSDDDDALSEDFTWWRDEDAPNDWMFESEEEEEDWFHEDDDDATTTYVTHDDATATYGLGTGE
jgi:hypothetical protein